jgi:type IV fimbrial biogenesis protein FimT
MMVVCGVVGILLAIGVPSYRYVTASNRATTEINGLLADLQFARSEAIREGQQIDVCATTNFSSCVTSGTTWNTGWLVMSGANILRIQPGFTGGDSLQSDNSIKAVSFSRRALRRSSQRDHLYPNDSSSNAQYTRCLSSPSSALCQPRSAASKRRRDDMLMQHGVSRDGMRYSASRSLQASLIEVMVALIVLSVGLWASARVCGDFQHHGCRQALAGRTRGRQPRRPDACEPRLLDQPRCVGRQDHGDRDCHRDYGDGDHGRASVGHVGCRRHRMQRQRGHGSLWGRQRHGRLRFEGLGGLGQRAPAQLHRHHKLRHGESAEHHQYDMERKRRRGER